MLYLRNITDTQSARIPLNGFTVLPDGVTLKVTNTVSLAEYDVAVVAPVQNTAIYAVIQITLPEGMPDGSYEYRLSQGAETISRGCLQIGEYETSRIEYGKTAEYQQYGD